MRNLDVPNDVPNDVQNETISSCNARCGFCPYPETSRGQPQGAAERA